MKYNVDEQLYYFLDSECLRILETAEKIINSPIDKVVLRNFELELKGSNIKLTFIRAMETNNTSFILKHIVEGEELFRVPFNQNKLLPFAEVNKQLVNYIRTLLN